MQSEAQVHLIGLFNIMTDQHYAIFSDSLKATDRTGIEQLRVSVCVKLKSQKLISLSLSLSLSLTHSLTHSLSLSHSTICSSTFTCLSNAGVLDRSTELLQINHHRPPLSTKLDHPIPCSEQVHTHTLFILCQKYFFSSV